MTGIDIDAETLQRAKRFTPSQTRVTFVEGDVITHPFRNESFDFITSVASLHHLPLEPALERFRSLLRCNGVLAIVGLYRLVNLTDYAWAVIASPTSLALRCLHGYAKVTAPLRDPAETLEEIQQVCDLILPGAQLRRELLFRYSLIWRKPFNS